MNQKLKKYVPHILAVILFLCLSVAYFAPVVLENKDLVQGDILKGLAWGKDLRDYHQQTGNYAFWSNSMFSGMPANFTFMPPMYNIFKNIGAFFLLYLPGYHIGLVFLYLIGFYIFMIALGCRPWLSIVGAIAYAFASYNLIIIGAGHVNKALVVATMAPMLGGIILTYRKNYVWGAIITLISTGLNVFWGHQQISYYQLIIILILAVVYFVYAVREKTVKDFFVSSAILLVVALIAVAPAAGKLISTADYTKETMRGGAILQNDVEGKKESSGLDIDYAYMWSYGKAETMTLLIPNFYGASSQYNIGENSELYNLYKKAGVSAAQAAQASKYAPMYWGDESFTEGPVYMGAIVCFLFVLGLFVVKGREKWWILIATIIAIIMAWGRHFPLVNDFLFYHLPLYNKFRVPSMILVIPGVTMAALGILALKEILENGGSRGNDERSAGKERLSSLSSKEEFFSRSEKNRDKYLKSIYISLGITGGLCLLFTLFGGSLLSFTNAAEMNYPMDYLNALIADRKSMMGLDALRSFAFIGLASGMLGYYLRKPLKTSYVIAVIGILIFIDLWTVDKRFLNDDRFVPKQKAQEFVATPADKLILQDKDPNYRVLNLTTSAFQESYTSYFHKSIGGYSPAKLRRYQDMIDYYLSKGMTRENINIFNMLNTRYVIFQTEQGQGPQVHLNSEALGNAWFVNEIQWVDSPDKEIVALKDIDPAQTAVIDTEWKEKIPNWEKLQHETPDSTATIRLTDYVNPGNLIYESTGAKPHLAVFSEVYYKTWRAYINGVEAPLVRVNYILRGLEIPAGSHTIEFKCVDEIYQTGAKMSLIASIITGIVLLCLFGFSIWREVRLYKK